MIEDACLERSRRQAWARFFAMRSERDDLVLRFAELALRVDGLDVDDETRFLIDAALEPIDDHVRRRIEAYIARPAFEVA